MADIEATAPIEIAATEAKVYDKWVVDQLVFAGNGVSSPLVAEAFLVPGARKEDGTWDLYPQGRKNIYIADVWAEVSTRPDFAAALGAVQAALEAYGKEKGIL